MRKLILTCIFLVCTSITAAQEMQWLKSFAGNSSTCSVKKILEDSNGNLMAFGQFSGTVDFDPGPGTFTLSSSGYDKYFLVKTDPNGNFLWALRHSAGTAIHLDKDNHIYLIGTYSYGGTYDLDPGPTIYTVNLTGGFSSSCVLKLDATGNFLRAGVFKGTVSWAGVTASSVWVDDSKNTLIAGSIAGGPIDLDPGPGTYFVSAWESGFNPPPTQKSFVLRLDSAGNFISTDIWQTYPSSARLFPQQQGDAVCVDVDPSYLGQFRCYDSSGTLTTKFYISTWSPSDLKLDGTGNMHIVGRYFYYNTDFDSGPGVQKLPFTSGSQLFFHSCLSGSGTLKRVGGIACNNDDYFRYDGIATDAGGNEYAVGTFSGTIKLALGGIYSFLTSTTSCGFIYKLNPNGYMDWFKKLETNANSSINGISTSVDGSLLMWGAFTGSTDFDLSKQQNLINAISTDAFIMKWAPEFITDIEKQYLDQTVRIYPNPTADKLYVDISEGTGDFTCRIYDLSGRLFRDTRGHMTEVLEIDLSELNNGAYLVETTVDGLMRWDKVIVAKK